MSPSKASIPFESLSPHQVAYADITGKLRWSSWAAGESPFCWRNENRRSKKMPEAEWLPDISRRVFNLLGGDASRSFALTPMKMNSFILQDSKLI